MISNLLGGSKILLIGNVIEQEFTQTGNWNLGSGLSIVLMLFIIFNMVISVITDKEGEANTIMIKTTAQKIYLGLIFIFLYAPIITLIVLSFNASKTRAKWGGFTTKWYAALFRNEQIMQALWNTLALAILSALIATLIGTIACIAMQSMQTYQPCCPHGSHEYSNAESRKSLPVSP